MEREEKRSPLVVVLMVLMLLAMALFLGGIARQLTLFFGRTTVYANSVGALSAMGLFGVFLIALFLWEVTPE